MNFAIIKRRLLNEKLYLISLAAAFAVGIVVGVLFNTRYEKTFIISGVIDFYINALTVKGNMSALFFGNVFSGTCILLLFFALSFVSVLFPIYYLFLFYRGYILGLAAGIFLSKFGINGLMLFIFAVMIGNIVTSAALIVFAALTRRRKVDKCKLKKNEVTKYFLLCLALSLVGAIFELVFTLLILRPLNFSFQ